MQPEDKTNQPNSLDANLSVPPPPPPPAPEPVVQQYQNPPVTYQAPVQQSYMPSNFTGGYFNTLKTLFSDPKSYFSSSSSSFLHSLIFPAINLVVMILVLFLTTIISVLTMKTSEGSSPFDKLTGEFWGELFKSIGLSSLYAVLFLGIIAGVIYIFAIIAKKGSEYKDILSMSSIFSLNFLAVAATSIISLVFSWVDSSDFLSVVNTLNLAIESLIFVYAVVLIIQGIVTVTEFNYFKAAAILVVSSIFVIFITNKIIKDSYSHFVIKFGEYNNSISGAQKAAYTLKNILDDFDY